MKFRIRLSKLKIPSSRHILKKKLIPHSAVKHEQTKNSLFHKICERTSHFKIPHTLNIQSSGSELFPGDYNC
jgi:hypothetical protein